eukprot:1161013-Pelagomonas_calceolata.AAC.10
MALLLLLLPTAVQAAMHGARNHSCGVVHELGVVALGGMQHGRGAQRMQVRPCAAASPGCALRHTSTREHTPDVASFCA